MKIGIFTALFGDKTLDQTLDIVQEEGIQAIELGVGAYPGAPHIEVEKLLESSNARSEFLKKIHDRGLIISALSVHGNPLHPDAEFARSHHEAFVKGVELCDALDIRTLNGFSGCPGDNENAVNPNWVTCAWPDEYRHVLDWQWSKKVIPYWSEQADLLQKHNVNFAIEMHPGFVVYNNHSLLRLRNEAGKNGSRIGANFDPSHLWWQGIDPIAAVKQIATEGALFHVHAKDTEIDAQNSSLDGNLDARPYSDFKNRSWSFRSVGYGHGVEWWKQFVSALRVHGYDHVLSIEHEDGLMTSLEGLRKAVSVLKEAVIAEPAGPMFWAE